MYIVLIQRTQRRQLCRFHGRQSHYKYRFWFVKGGWIVQSQVQFALIRQRQRRNILVLGRVNVAQDSGQVHHRSYIRTVKSAAHERRIAHGSDEICGRTGSERRHHRLAVPVIQNKQVSVLSQARPLLLGWLVEALLIESDVEASGEQFRALLQRLGVEIRGLFHVAQIFFEPQTIQARLIQILRRPNERSGPTAHRTPQGVEVTAGFRSQEKQRLL